MLHLCILSGYPLVVALPAADRVLASGEGLGFGNFTRYGVWSEFQVMRELREPLIRFGRAVKARLEHLRRDQAEGEALVCSAVKIRSRRIITFVHL